MPNRILRDWTDSLAIHNAGEAGENLFGRIIMKADDFGRYTSDPQLLRSLCYPHRDDLRNADMSRRLVSIQAAGLIFCYEVTDTGTSRWLDVKELSGVCAVGTKRYLLIPKFGQQKRALTSKYPDPPPDDGRLIGKCLANDTQLRPYAKAETKAKALIDFEAMAPDFSNPKFKIAWEEFEQHRREIKHPLTVTSAKKMASKFQRWGVNDSILAINTSIENGWQGVFPPSHNGSRNADSAPIKPTAPLTDTVWKNG